MKNEDLEKIITIASALEAETPKNPGYHSREKRRQIAEIVDSASLLKLKDLLADWTDVDGAEFDLACMLGLFAPTQAEWFKNKGVFWTNNTLGNLLYEILQTLTKAGILEFRDEPDLQYRWNQNWRLLD
ncbi:MAG: hypothetical protein K8T20_13140 [Planctomycetes bacterium]|nr:hypothetical protein [Planctomycetota bacterium]